MALECKKTSGAGLVVSKLPPRNDNDQQAPVTTMINGRDQETVAGPSRRKTQADVDIKEVYFLIMHFLSEGPCRRASAQLEDELQEYGLLPRRYHAWYSRSGTCSGESEDNGLSVPLSYSQLLERFSFIEQNHLVRLLEELFNRTAALHSISDAKNPTAADASTLLGTGSVSLLNIDSGGAQQVKCSQNRAGQVYGLTLREVGGGLARHHRAPAIRAASYQIVKPSVLVSRIQKIKTFRGHRNAVYCAIFDKSGEYIITGSDDRLVKIWSTATGFCLCSCRGHEGDITDLAVSANNLLLASASNDCFIRVWRFPDGYPLSVLKGHTSAVTAIAFSPRQGCEYLLLSASDDGTCRIWDARDSSRNARIYVPEGQESGAKISESGQPNVQPRTQMLCCAFNASGTVFVTGSADKLARVWDACKWSDEIHGGPYHEFDTLKGHEDDVNYVQFSGCASPSRPVNVDSRPVNLGAPAKNERISRFRNSWFGYESIVSCSRDGSAIIWVPRPRKYHGKSKWMKGYHLRVPPPPMPPQPPRGVPRQRLLPTPRGVNMIVWSLDNRYVLAAIMDCRICVWNAVDGGLVHSLTGHTKSTFVLDVHPHDPRIAMSAGYDGRVIIWDIWEGRTIHEYNIGDFHLVDGKFSPDGTSIVISDEVGQIYLLATGEGRSQKDAKYDQFFLGDYRPLARDVHGNVLDQETQITPHARNMRDLLCDANMIPYAEPYQSMYQQRRLGAIGINWHPPPAQWVAGSADDSSYLTVGFPLLPLPDEDDSVHEAHQVGTRWVEQPFDEEAMEWEQDSVDDAGSDYTLSFENACEEDERDCSLTSSEDHSESFDEENSSEEDELSQRARLRRSERNKKKEEEVATSSRSTKRKHRDGGKDYSLRRSKRHKKNKRLSRKSSSRRGSDGEQSKGRPRRLAAKNARLFFSRIGAEEEEHSDSDSSQDVESAGEEQQSSRQSHEKEDGDKHDLENTEEGSTAEPEPSEVRWSRPTRSNPSGKLRISTRKAPEAQASAQVAGADAFSAEDIPEEQVHTSLANTSMDSTCQRETLWDGQANSTATSNRGEKSGIMSDPELDAVSPLSGKRRRIVSSSNANKSPRVDFFREEPSRVVENELWVNQTGNIHVPSKDSEEGRQSPHVSLQPINVPGTCLHTLKNGDSFGFASENAGLKQRESSLDGYETETHDKESSHKVSEKMILYENNVRIQEPNDDAELSNQSCHVSELQICDVEEQSLKGQEQEYVGSFVHDDGRALKETNSSMRLNMTEPLVFQDARLEHDENDTIEDKCLDSLHLKFNNDSAVEHLAEEEEDGCQLADPLAIIGEEYFSNEKSEFVEEACLNTSNKSLSAQGKPIKVALGSLRKHQPMGTSWKHNSAICLWLRQDTDEAQDAGHSSSEVESANDENMAEGLTRHRESGQAHNLKLTFRRGKRRALKPRKRVDFKPNSPAAVDVKDMPEPTPQDFEGKLDEDEFMDKMKVTLTYVRTRRHGKSVEDKESSKGSDTGLRTERREGLRFSIRSKSNIEDGDQGRTAEDFSRKWRKNNKVSWLMLTKVEDGTRYIPQFGDEVAYVLQGQDEFPKLSRLEDKGAPKGLRSQLRAVELCEVVGLEYKNLAGFSGVSCNLTLRLIGGGCKALGRTFRLSLPELTDFPDFIIDRSRYEASLRRNWTKRDRCKVWWRLNTVDENGEEKTGKWFFGRVMAVETKSSQFPDSPWDACMVQYIGDSTGPHRHSPWELFDVDSDEIVPSHINEATRIQILSTIEDIEASCASSEDEYGLRALRTLLRKQDFLNKTLVPLGLDTIKDRLKNRYYRSLDAFQYDIQLLATNVQDYLCDDELTFQVQNLADKLLKEG